MKRIILIILLVISSQLSVAYPVIAQSKNDFSLSISPSILEIEAHAPANPQSQLTLQNKSEKDVTLNIILKAFTQDGLGSGIITYLPKQESDQKLLPLINKIDIIDAGQKVTKVKLAPFESKTIQININADTNLPTGDYYFSVLFIKEDNEKSSKSAVDAGGGIGAHIILSVSNNKAFFGRITEFKAPSILSHGPVPFKLLLQNRSDRYTIPRGRIEIKDMFGANLPRVYILPQYLLARSNRYLIDLDKKGLSTSSVIWPDKFLFGIYKATAIIKLSENSPALTQSTYFIGIPFVVLFGFSLAAFIVCGIYLRIKRKYITTKKS